MKLAVIVGRFQVAELTDGHKELINKAIEYERALIVVGMRNPDLIRNPLPPRCVMDSIENYISNLGRLDADKVYIRTFPDHKSDNIWSVNLDLLISSHLYGEIEPVLIGGRDSFLEKYTGRFKGKILLIEGPDCPSGTEAREESASTTSASKDFRHGVIWAAHNYKKVVKKNG